MMYDHMEGMSGMMWGMGVVGLLVVVALVLGIVALAKYVLSDARRGRKDE